MTRRHARVAALACVAALAACESKSVVGAGGATQAPSRGGDIGEFSDNPSLAFAPSNTPYAFASFRAFPIDLVRKMFSKMLPVWRGAFESYLARASEGSAGQQRVAKDLLDALAGLDVKAFEAHGFSTQARLAIYGIGAYPVLRIELSSGDRVFDLVRRTAERWEAKLPPPVERAGRRYWLVDGPDTSPKLALLAAIAPKELVFAVAPRSALEANLAALLGEARPAGGSLTTAQFRTLAERNGFNGYGVGFVDLVRVGDLIANVVGAKPECRANIASLAKRTPRVVIGYGNVTLQEIAYGMVLELAPDVLADMRSLSSQLAGLDRLRGQKAMMSFALAANLEHGRTLLRRIASAAQVLGMRCELPDLVAGAGEASAAAARPLPPLVAGLRGGFVVLNDLTMGSDGPQSIEGFGSVQLDHAGELLKLAASQLPGFSVPLDGAAHALPSILPFPGHVAASESAIGFGMGSNSSGVAVAALQGKPARAPLALFQFDYAHLGKLLATLPQDNAEMNSMRELFKTFGRLTMTLDTDERGVVAWTSLELP